MSTIYSQGSCALELHAEVDPLRCGSVTWSNFTREAAGGAQADVNELRELCPGTPCGSRHP